MNSHPLIRSSIMLWGRRWGRWGVVCVHRKSYLSKSSSSNHLQHLKVVSVQPHVLHSGGEGFHCRHTNKGSGKQKQDAEQIRLKVTVLRGQGTKTLQTGSSSLIFNSSDQGSDLSGSHTGGGTATHQSSSSFLQPEMPAELNQVDHQEPAWSFRSRTQTRFSDADVSQRVGRGYVSLIVQSKSIKQRPEESARNVGLLLSLRRYVVSSTKVCVTMVTYDKHIPYSRSTGPHLLPNLSSPDIPGKIKADWKIYSEMIWSTWKLKLYFIFFNWSILFSVKTVWISQLRDKWHFILLLLNAADSMKSLINHQMTNQGST